MSVPEPQEDMVGSEWDTLNDSEYEGLVFDLLDYQVQPGVEFLVFHLYLVGACDGFDDSILDHTNHTFYSSDACDAWAR